MVFLRVVEVFPPLFPVSEARVDRLAIEVKIESFIEGVRSIRNHADLFLVANVKNPNLLKISTVEAAAMLQERLNVEAAPVIVVRDQNRPQFLSSVLTGIALGLKSMMIAWGDRYPASAGASNVRDFSSLGEAIRQASLLRGRARASIRFFAPVDIDRLPRRGGVKLAKERLKAGAEDLLAQPPTTDAEGTFDKHSDLIGAAGLRDRVLLNVFPFKDSKDVKDCEKYFGWKLPKSVHATAANGVSSLLQAEREVVRRLRHEGYPGVYVSTRGTPNVAEKLLA